MPTRTLIIRFGSLGDVILTSATVLNYKLTDPGGHVVYLTKERYRPVVERFDGVDEVVAVPDHVSVAGLYRTLLALDERTFTTVVDLHGNSRSWLARKLVGADWKAVYPKARRERWHAVRRGHRSLGLDGTPGHTIDRYNQTLTDAGRDAYCRRPQLRFSLPPPTMQEFLRASSPVVVIAPGAAHPPKQWPIEKFALVAEKLYVRHGARIIWAITGTDASKVRMRQQVPSQELFELINEPIEYLAAVIAASTLTIANDSGIAHLSSAVGTPVLSLFGPTHPVLGFSPRGLHDRVIEVDEFCRPCSRHGARPCYRDEQYCFSRITVDRVVDEAASVIHAQPSRYRALLLDRDGTIMIDKGYLSDPDGVELISGVPDALKRAREAGFKLVIVSNQSGVARGTMTIEDVERVNARLLERLSAKGVSIDGVFYCPDYKNGTVPEFSRESENRKPGPGMAEEAALSLGLDLRHSVVVGDKLSDLHLGRVIGARSLLVRTGEGRATEQFLTEVGEPYRAADSLIDAVDGLLGQ